MTIKAGRETSEHARASRAEAAGFTLLGSGLVFAVLGALQGPWLGAAVGLVLAAIGAALLASVNRASWDGRSSIKAAAVRRPADQAPVKVI